MVIVSNTLFLLTFIIPAVGFIVLIGTAAKRDNEHDIHFALGCLFLGLLCGLAWAFIV